MIALDTNILVYAHREDSPHHARAAACLRHLAEGPRRWALPWPVVHEFLAIVTHPRIYAPPTSVEDACAAVDDLLALPGVLPIGEGAGHGPALVRLLRESGAIGPRVHDARIATICLGHGVDELWSADRDFGYFPDLRVRNPLVEPIRGR